MELLNNPMVEITRRPIVKAPLPRPQLVRSAADPVDLLTEEERELLQEIEEEEQA
jgi:hypothetical protein